MSSINGQYSNSYTDTDGEYTDGDEDFEDYGPIKESVIIFIDVDSFDVQVRGRNEGIAPEILKTEPFIVVNESKVITAVNYPAKECGVTRSRDCTEQKAKQLCRTKNIHLNVLQIPSPYGKPDNLEPAKASDEIYESVENSLQRQCETRPLPTIERASKDEFYLDVTDEVYFRVHNKGMLVPSWHQVQALAQRKCLLETPRHTAKSNKLSYRTLQVIPNQNIAQKRHVTEGLLMHGAVIANILLEDIKNDTSFTLSAGVSSNKLLSKIGGGLNKPEAITVLPHASLPRVSKKVKIESIPGLGGKLGQEVKMKFNVHTMAQLSSRNRTSMQRIWKNGEEPLRFHQLAVGQDFSKVVAKKFSSMLTCGITFNYRTRRMATREDFHENLWNRFEEMAEHINYNFEHHGSARIPKSFRLEVCTRKGGLKFAFKETIDIDDRLRKYIESKKGQNSNSTPKSLWKALYNDFLGRMRNDCKITLFAVNENLACEAVRKVSAINLVAAFDPEGNYQRDT